ncbi:hypothetical protein CHR53_25760 [Neobacillus mesonae]|uniref:Uncharacterized protein n=1 Tax=Neobacillus mesonae TaxID=1193713 RepID=A0A3Q9R1V0_9BACI|nr:hypothetical protein CHR53_25760 [Neobacillus mesonae]
MYGLDSEECIIKIASLVVNIILNATGIFLGKQFFYKTSMRWHKYIQIGIYGEIIDYFRFQSLCLKEVLINIQDRYNL